MTMLGVPMPWPSVPCAIWLPHALPCDEWGNVSYEFREEPDIGTRCCYAPGRYRPETTDDIEDGRPDGTEERMTFFLPKGLTADLRGARIAAMPPDDPYVFAAVYDVVGVPRSYHRASTPGDYSWCVEGVRRLG